MAVRTKRRKRKLKTSFKVFTAVFLLFVVLLLFKLCGVNDNADKNDAAIPEAEITAEQSVHEPEITVTSYNEYIDVETVNDGERCFSYPILKQYDAINQRVRNYIEELSVSGIQTEFKDAFYNFSYYSVEFTGDIYLNYDVKNQISLELKNIAPPLYEEYGEIPFFLDSDSVTLYTEEGKKDILFSEYGGRKYLPYNPPEYSPAAEGEKIIALTFDDGPRRPEITRKILDKLTERRAKASFFVLGLECPGRGDTLKRIVDSGCEIGNHTYRHEQLNKISRQDALNTVLTTQELVYESTGVYPTVMRPPYGDEREDIMEELGLFNIKWSVDPEDWKVKNASAIVEHVKEKAYSGAIVLMHDVYDASGEAAVELIDYFCDNGWRLVTVSEMFDLKNADFTKEVFCFKEQ